MCDIEVSQKTPIQLLHHMKSTTKKHMIKQIKLTRKVEEENECDQSNTTLHHRHSINCCYEFEMSDVGGIYIKEFVHGDFGRTVPSLSSVLGVLLELIELNIITKSCNWPPESKESKDAEEKKPT